MNNDYYYSRYEKERLRNEFRNTKLSDKDVFDVLNDIIYDKKGEVDDEVNKLKDEMNSGNKSVEIQKHLARLFNIQYTIHDIKILLDDVYDYASGMNKCRSEIRRDFERDYREAVENGLIPDDDDDDNECYFSED